jgi:hypothetical protein
MGLPRFTTRSLTLDNDLGFAVTILHVSLRGGTPPRQSHKKSQNVVNVRFTCIGLGLLRRSSSQ